MALYRVKTATAAAAVVLSSMMVLGISAPAFSQTPSPSPAPPNTDRSRPRERPAPIVSPEVLPDHRVTFRILAPRAQSVRLNAGDIPGPPPAMTKGENGVWEATTGPVDPGAYRYNFDVDGVPTIDPRNPLTSQSYTNTWSLFAVPGSAMMDTTNVPHGAVAALPYYSTALSTFRRLHVYTPPGYEAGGGRYPVFYLLHGAGDSDDSWGTVGRAGFILDNLIASGRAKPMIVVMPAGHTGPMNLTGADPFEADFITDIVPLIQKDYRVRTDRNDTGIAGLSMGGGQTLNLAMAHPELFGYVGVFSSGLFRAFPFGRPGAPAPAATGQPSPWETEHLSELENPSAKKGLKLIWFSTGSDDFLLPISLSTVDMFKRHGYSPVFVPSTGAHTWLNWRKDLIEFAPQLFR